MAKRKSTHVYATINAPNTSTDWLERKFHYMDGTSVGRDFLYVKVTGGITAGSLQLESRVPHYDGTGSTPTYVTGPTGDIISSEGDYVYVINGQTDYRITSDATFAGNVTVIISTGSNEELTI